MASFHSSSVNITEIEVDLNNPRFDQATDQRDAIHKMLEDQQTSSDNKLFNLMKDIVENGLNPMERLVLTRSEDDQTKYIVLEGNRRIISLKLLGHPPIIQESYPKIYRKILKLKEEYDSAPITHVDSVIFDDPTEAKRWIELKHTGDNDGVGVAQWSTEQQSRFKDKGSMIVQVLDFVKKSPEVDDTFRSRLNELSVTNLGRLMGTPDFRETVGIALKKSKLVSDLTPEELYHNISIVINDLLDPGFTVDKIKSVTQRRDYANRLKTRMISTRKSESKEWHLEQPDWTAPVTTGGDSGSSSATNTDAAPATPTPAKPSKKGKTTPHTKDRETLIPSAFKVPIEVTKVNNIYDELRRLDANHFPNCSGVMFRVFLETLIRSFLAKKGKTQKWELKDAIDATIAYLISHNLFTEEEAKGIRHVISSGTGTINTQALNLFVHSYNYQPDVASLKTQWDNIENFVRCVAENY